MRTQQLSKITKYRQNTFADNLNFEKNLTSLPTLKSIDNYFYHVFDVIHFHDSPNNNFVHEKIWKYLMNYQDNRESKRHR